jgi:hypothetical protein
MKTGRRKTLDRTLLHITRIQYAVNFFMQVAFTYYGNSQTFQLCTTNKLADTAMAKTLVAESVRGILPPLWPEFHNNSFASA